MTDVHREATGRTTYTPLRSRASSHSSVAVLEGPSPLDPGLPSPTQEELVFPRVSYSSPRGPALTLQLGRLESMVVGRTALGVT